MDKVAVLIPCYNESKTIEKVIKDFKAVLPDVYGQAKPLFLLANAGQIFYFISESLMVIVLRFTGEKLQIILNAGYAVIF